MALDFPGNPIDGQTYNNYYYDATTKAWRSLGSVYAPNYLKNATFTTTTAAGVPLTVQGTASQSGNLQEWKNSSGTVLASIDASGSQKIPFLGIGGAIPPISTTGYNLDVTGRIRTKSDGVVSGGMWMTGSSGVESAFIGQFSPTTTDPVGIYHGGAWRFLVDNSGRVTMPSQPSFLAMGSSGTSYTTAGGGIIPFPVALSNIGNAYNTSTYRFTALVAGTYVITTTIYTFTTFPGWIALFKNGSQYAPTDVFGAMKSSSAPDGSVTFSAAIPLALGDYISIGQRSGQSNLSSYGGHSIFSGYLLG